MFVICLAEILKFLLEKKKKNVKGKGANKFSRIFFALGNIAWGLFIKETLPFIYFFQNKYNHIQAGSI